MLITAIIAVLAVSAANAYKSEGIASEIILAKYSPRTNYEVEKICEFAEQQNYQNQNEDLSDETYGTRSVHGAVQPDPKTKQQIQRCCNKMSQFEKKQCLKDVRENFLDKQCDIQAINHMCCKTTGDSRYTCFTKNTIDRPWPSSSSGSSTNKNRNRAAPSPFELDDEVAGPWVTSEERVRRHQSPREQDVEQLRRELREPQRRRGWAAANQNDEENEGAARFTYRERVEDRQTRRQAGHDSDDNEEERKSWGQDRVVDAIREIERIREQRVFGQQLERPDSARRFEFEADRAHEWQRREQDQPQEQERQRWAQPQEDMDQDIFESQQHQRRAAWDAQQSAEDEAERRRTETDAERVARQARWTADSAEEAWAAAERLASQGHHDQQEHDWARRHANQAYEDQPHRARRDARRSEGTENFDDELIDIMEKFRRFESDPESDNEGSPARKESRQHGQIESATKAAAQQACNKNARRQGRNVQKTCCEAGSLVGETAGRRQQGGQVCPHALHKFQSSEARECGVSHKPQCKPAFIHCCRRRAQNPQRRDDASNAFEQERW